MNEMEIAKCWSFNMDGQRCMQPAGHDGLHAVITEWSDDKSWTPTAVVSIPMGVADGHLRPQPVYEPVGSGRCGICEHPHHPEGPCQAQDGDFDCGCSTSIED